MESSSHFFTYQNWQWGHSPDECTLQARQATQGAGSDQYRAEDLSVRKHQHPFRYQFQPSERNKDLELDF